MTTVRITETDRRTHMNIVGRTGTGKSHLMYQMIEQDIEDGRGVAVLDPLGNLVKRILQEGIPDERIDDVVVLDFAQTDYPVPLNVFALGHSYASLGRIVNAIERLYATTGVRTERYLRAGIQALQKVKQPTMRDLYMLFVDEWFRYGILKETREPDVYHTLHDEFHAASASKQSEIREPILNRIGPFYTNPYLYPSLCHPQCIDFAKLIDENRIVLISLNASREAVPDTEKSLVGQLLISLMQMVGMSKRRETHPYYVYIDEVQDFVTDTLATIFNQARQFGLAMTVAHQFFHQLPETVRSAVTNNAGATIVFQTNPKDAQFLAPYMGDTFDKDKLVNLNLYQSVALMRYKGETQPPFQLFPFPPPLEDERPSPQAALQREYLIRRRSIENYTPMHIKQVREWLDKRYPPINPDPKPPSSPPPAPPPSPAKPAGHANGEAPDEPQEQQNPIEDDPYDDFIDPDPA